MPKPLKEFPKPAKVQRKTKYPYGDWFEQAKETPIELIAGEDFKSTPKSIRNNLYRYAENNDKRIQTREIENEDGTISVALEFIGDRY